MGVGSRQLGEVQASEVAQRWHRQLQGENDEPTLDEELDRLLGKRQD
jgi:hypothetical protein